MYDSLRDKLFASASELFADEGFHPVGFIHQGSLDSGEGERVTVSLAPGEEIALVGVCDSDCSDLDMTLLDPDGEQVAEEDEALENIQDAIREYLIAVEELITGSDVREVEVAA